MKRSTRIKRAAITVALVLAAPAAHAGLQSNGWTNGLTPNGIGPNGIHTTNGLGSSNGINTTNGLGSTNGFELLNGFGNNGLAGTNGFGNNGLGTMNGFSGNGLRNPNGFSGNGHQPAHKTGCEGIDRHVFCGSASNPFSALSIKPLGAPAHDAAVE